MKSTKRPEQRGSGLILALGILAMMAIMATTFVTLMRINTQLSRIYADDAAAELLAQGVVNYTLAVLRDDQDRSLFKYENRDQAVGGRGSWQGMSSYDPSDPKAVTDFHMSLPGRNTDWWAPTAKRYATGPSNDVWFHCASDGYVEVGLYDSQAGHREGSQASFGGGGQDFTIVDRNDTPVGWHNHVEQAKPERYYAYVSGNFNGVDDDCDGITDPNYRWDGVEGSWFFPPEASDECNALTRYHYDQTQFLTYGRSCYLHPGGKLTGDFRMTGGAFWRWAAKIGIPEERYMNLNAIGNNEMAVGGSGRLNNLDGRGLQAFRGDTSARADHLGMLSWRGYAGEYVHTVGGFDYAYNAVQYSPYQLDAYRLLTVGYSDFPTNPTDPTSSSTGAILSQARTAAMTDRWIRDRWGADSLPADGTPKWRVGWRKDGATYHKIPSPDNPLGDDHYFGASEALNHQNEDIIPGTSRIFSSMVNAAGGNINEARMDYGRSRAYASTYGCDTILRGKIWPSEGRPYTSSAGDWRHINILRKVNLNMLGASGPENLPDEDRALKLSWRSKRSLEQERLYYMLKAMLTWTGTPEPEHEACQLVASLSDMVDRDHDESYYGAPDGSGAWALGVEKHPVINEIGIHLANARRSDYSFGRMRVELYNPAENIPWVPDSEEAYDVSNYVLRIGTHNYRVGDLWAYAHDDPNTPVGHATTIGADGLYSDPNDVTANKQTWSRILHVGWNDAVLGVDWPTAVSREDINAPIRISLWKPLTSDASAGNPAGNCPVTSGKVEDFAPIGGLSGRYVCVDHTGMIQLVRTHTSSTGPGGSEVNYVGLYRRWDPMNARIYGRPDDTNATTREKSTVLWCLGWYLGRSMTWGRPNVDYALNLSSITQAMWDRVSFSPNKYERRFETNWKVPDCDLPSVGWIGEACLKNAAQDGPLTWVHAKGQDPHPTSGSRADQYANRLESAAKMDLFRPWNRSRNLHLYDMFTVWDPMHDGVDNDGDGAIDEADTGRQDGDLWGPEVRVYGLIDVNHASMRAIETLMPGDVHPRTSDIAGFGPSTERGQANHVSSNWHCMGPRESIGDMLRMDDLHAGAGARLSCWPAWSPSDYISSRNLHDGSGHWGVGMYRNHDDDKDGIVDERDERDFWFTQIANYLTTRDHTLTIEIVVQMTDPPFHPGKKYVRGAYKVRNVYSNKHLILLVDRSTTLRIDPGGRCDFTGPMRILARRWGHDRR